MSEVFKVSRSGYYKWKKELPNRLSKHSALDSRIEEVFEFSRATYGSPRVHKQLGKQGVQTSKSTVARRMKALQISPKRKRKFKQTTDSKHNKAISPNLLARNFEVSKLARVWVSDIT